MSQPPVPLSTSLTPIFWGCGSCGVLYWSEFYAMRCCQPSTQKGEAIKPPGRARPGGSPPGPFLALGKALGVKSEAANDPALNKGGGAQ